MKLIRANPKVLPITLLLICLFLLGSSGLLHSSQNAQTEILPYQQDWLGGDAAYSIPLGPGRSLWLFGDTYVGNENAKNRSQTTGFVRNSIRITDCRGKNCTTHYFWSNMHRGEPKSFFDTKTDHWFWPLDGFVDKNVLYIFLEERVKRKEFSS